MESIIADLHVHSRFSRATSNKLDLENLEKYAKIKGVELLGTGDFQHPEWSKEVNELEERKGILYSKTGFPFILQTEISLIYTQDGKGRRIHHVILCPGKEEGDKVTDFLKSKGRIDYDGRPIFGFSSVELVDELKKISKDIEIIPAHCLLPDSKINTQNSVKEIREIKKGDKVLTHKGRCRKVEEVYKRKYFGKILEIVPSCLKIGAWFTPEHPIYAIKSYKNCKNVPHTICKPSCRYIRRNCKIRAFENYSPDWIQVKDLEKGDIVLYPRKRYTKNLDKLDLSKFLKNFYAEKEFIKPRNAKIFLKNIPIKKKIFISQNFCRLIGYYLAEGDISKNHVGFSFNENEKKYLDDLKKTLFEIFGKYLRIKEVKEDSKGISLLIYSKILYEFFKYFYKGDTYRSHTKKIPAWMINLPKSKIEQLILGWWRGDKGVTTSVYLMNQFKNLFIKLGIIPSIDMMSTKNIKKIRKKKPSFIKGRYIKANKNCYYFRFLCSFEGWEDLFKYSEFKKFKTKISRRRGWIDEKFIYLPIIEINKKNYKGEVYNLEVKQDSSYLTENLAVHNCMTPWFGIFGSKGGFNSLKECFQEKTKEINAVESGISADIEMLRKFSFLNSKSIISSSDLHSFWPWRIGRESTIFNLENKNKLNYKDIIKQIRENSFLGTIETYPSYGRYHFDGHRKCNFSCSPSETKKLKGMCPKCGKPLTVGVDYRVEELADQKSEVKKKVYELIPLHELIAVSKASSLSTKKTWNTYNQLIDNFGNEFNILLNASKEEILKVVPNDNLLADLIIKNRNNKIKIKPGYDGEYGELDIGEKQERLF